MKKEIAHKIAHIFDAEIYQVELFDHRVIEYFVAHAEQFIALCQSAPEARYGIWFNAYRQSRLMSLQGGA